MNTDSIDDHSVALATLADQGDEPPSRFQELWNEAERLKRENVELETELDQLVHRIKSSVGPIEMDMGRAMRVQIDKLIVFGGRQSLQQWQLHVLDEWIMSSMDSLQSMGLVDDELADSMAKLQAQTLGFEIDTNSDLTASEQLAVYMEAQVKDMDAHLQEDDLATEEEEDGDILKWYKQQFSESEFDDLDAEDTIRGDAESEETLESETNDVAEPQAIFKTLFHRVARALHPDKEADPERREFKQALMAQLLEARRQRDLMLVFQLYKEHVDDTASFDEREFAELEKVLCQYIELESQRQLEITTKTHLHDIAYTQFYSDDPQEVNQAIEQKIKDIKKRQSEIEAFSKTVTSLKKLGPYLEARYERLRQYF